MKNNNNKNKQTNKTQSSCRWFVMPWCSYNMTVIHSLYSITQGLVHLTWFPDKLLVNSDLLWVLSTIWQLCCKSTIFMLENCWITNRGLNHWGRVTHIYVSILNIIGSDNDMSPVRHQAIIWTNSGILSIQNFCGIWCEQRPLIFRTRASVTKTNTIHFSVSEIKMSLQRKQYSNDLLGNVFNGLSTEAHKGHTFS